ncbi:MAG: alpha/beta hydrolase [Candidatus Nanoarchaeia archaeon]
MKHKTKIFVLHGGCTHSSRKKYETFLKSITISLHKRKHWRKEYLTKKLKKYEIIAPTMPLKENAKYKDWKIIFEKYMQQMDEDIILIGESLGGIFLAKYLSENKIKKNILGTYLVAPPFDNELSNEELVGGFNLPKDISLLQKQNQHLPLFFSKDDPVVNIEQAKKYQQQLEEKTIHIFESKNGHFRVEKFPELIKLIKKECR